MSETAVVVPPEPSFEDFLDSAIHQNLEKEQLEILQEKHAPPAVVDTPKPEPKPEPKPVEQPKPAEEPIAKPITDPNKDWAEALEFSKDLEKSPATPKTTAEKYPEKPPGAMTEKASSAWATLRHRATLADQLETQNKELAAKLAEFEAKTKDLADKEIVPKEIWTKAQKDQEELTNTLRLTNLEATPEFKQIVTVPMQEIRDQAKVLADRYNVSYRDVLNALEEPDESKQADMLSDLAETGQFKEKNKLDLFRYGDRMRELQNNRAKLTTNTAKTLEIIEHQRRQQQEAQAKQHEEAWNTALDRSWADLEKKVWMFQKVDSDPAWNQGLENLKTMVRSTRYQEMPLEKQAQILYQAAMVPKMIRALMEAKEIINSKDEALKKYVSGTPGAGAGEGSGAGAGEIPATADDNLGFVEAMLR